MPSRAPWSIRSAIAALAVAAKPCHAQQQQQQQQQQQHRLDVDLKGASIALTYKDAELERVAWEFVNAFGMEDGVFDEQCPWRDGG